MTSSIPSAPATPLERPQVRAGDRWTFATRVQGGAAALVLQHEVQAVDAALGCVVGVRNARNPGQPLLRQWFDAEMNRQAREFAPDEVIRYEPAFPLFRFPMAPGSRWQLSVQQRQDGEPGSTAIQVQARVLRWESVEVQAGRFDALRIEATHTGPSFAVETVYWYAPEAGRSVRGSEVTQGARGRSELAYELLQWQRQR